MPSPSLAFLSVSALWTVLCSSCGKRIQFLASFIHSVPFSVDIALKKSKKYRKCIDYSVYMLYNEKSTLHIARFLHLCQRPPLGAKVRWGIIIVTLQLYNMYTSCSSNVAICHSGIVIGKRRYWKQPAAADLKF